MVSSDNQRPSDETVSSQSSGGWADVAEKLLSHKSVFFTVLAMLVSAVTSFGMTYWQNQSSSNQLYIQLMSEQERSENEIRREMFNTALVSFLKPDKEAAECTDDRIRRKLLELEMIARNFHEAIDLKPLFQSLLLEILKDIPRAYTVNPQSIKALEIAGRNGGGFVHGDNSESLCRENFYARRMQKDDYKTLALSAFDVTGEARMKLLKDRMESIKHRRLRDLRKIAGRITNKQLESLSDVVQRFRLRIDLTGICQEKPNADPDADEPDACKMSSNRMALEGGCMDYELCCKENKNCSQRVLKLAGGKTPARSFVVFSDAAYTKWKQLKLTVVSGKTKQEIEADKDGNQYKATSFWLGYFDFPLTDNTLLSRQERFAVILDDIDRDKADISLLYFPASYAGFKEKSYYQHKTMEMLLQGEN